ncbi:hypothetical protein [Candidatus Nitrosotenuis aquarius]|uniref:hypothetical protein n=1 Tax=Candidatus Nitrosotenuis aquarius TaxID=1846278 RepID=UPI000C1F77E8|nr:hypothetical protein [Candidatus Nitrosotenuis aquarius]
MSTINYTPVSKPFLVTGVILSFIGTGIGSVWMLGFFGIAMPEQITPIFSVHRIFQLNGFVTLMIMGIGYMIIPRMRNELTPSNKLAKISYLFVVFSIAVDFAGSVMSGDYSDVATMLRLIGVSIFGGLMFYTLRILPKLLRESDYFIAISISLLVASQVMSLFDVHQNVLIQKQMWLFFPILMIFAIQYKTLPSFLGFIRPKRRIVVVSVGLAIVSGAFALASGIFPSMILDVAFNISLIATVSCFVLSLYVFGGFDDTEILKLISGEKKKRYHTIILHSRIAYGFLLAGLLLGTIHAMHLTNFALYDLTIHYIAIGFIGITIMLYLPIMIPPILEKSIRFLDFNHIPLILIISAIAIRTIGDVIVSAGSFPQPFVIFGISGFVILAGMFLFVRMIHRAMKNTNSELSIV